MCAIVVDNVVNEGSSAAVLSRPQYNGLFDAMVKITKHDGFKGLYQGVTPNVYGAGASWGLYFLL
jgi:solute carrier family 25 folate transporter 32